MPRQTWKYLVRPTYMCLNNSTVIYLSTMSFDYPPHLTRPDRPSPPSSGHLLLLGQSVQCTQSTWFLPLLIRCVDWAVILSHWHSVNHLIIPDLKTASSNAACFVFVKVRTLGISMCSSAACIHLVLQSRVNPKSIASTAPAVCFPFLLQGRSVLSLFKPCILMVRILRHLFFLNIASLIT